MALLEALSLFGSVRVFVGPFILSSSSIFILVYTANQHTVCQLCNTHRGI